MYQADISGRTVSAVYETISPTAGF
jgi:hypothetical protein